MDSGYSWGLEILNAAYVPEIYAGIGLQSAAIEQTRSVVRNVSNKASSGREYCENCGNYSYEWDGKKLKNGWVIVQGESADLDKPVNMDAEIWGMEAGFDLQKDANNTLGVFASYRKGDYDVKGKGSSYHSTLGSQLDIDSYLAGLYYRYDKNDAWLFASLYGGLQKADVKTDDGLGSFSTDGTEVGAGIEIGRSFAYNKNLIIDPSIGLYYTQINFDNTRDNLHKDYDWDSIKHIEAELGVRVTKEMEKSKIYVKPSVIRTITKGDSVKITGLKKTDTYEDETLGKIELGGRYGFSDNLSGYVWGNYTFGSSYDAASLGIGLNYAW